MSALKHLWVDGATRPVLVVTVGNKHAHCLRSTADGVRAVRVPRREAETAPDVTLKGQVYPVRRALKHYRAFARERGITKTAQRLLQEASNV